MTRPFSRLGALLLGSALGAFGCAGAIEGEMGEDDDTPPGTGTMPGPRMGTGGTGGTAGPPPGGLIDPPPMGMNPAAVSCGSGNPPATPRLVRLTRLQYENSIRDITGLDVRPSRELPEDPVFAGFDRGLQLEVGEVVTRVYRDTAEGVARQVVGTPAAYQRVVGCDPKTGDACAAAFISDFGKRVFRRPLADAEKTKYLALFKNGNMLIDGADPFSKGVQVVVEAMFQSPGFLYRAELSNRREGALIPLGAHELAARLSFTLVNTTPDAPLMAAADKNELVTPDQVVAHARRLLATPGGRTTMRDFYLQWMEVDHWADKLSKDRMRFPSFSSSLGPTLQKELEMFVEAVTFEQSKGLATLLSGPFTYGDKTTAAIYGAAPPAGTAIARIDLDPKQRGGILTQLGFLASHANAVQSSPIHRGVFVQRKVLCTPIPDPMEQVPALPPPSAGKTNREVVQEHTAPPGCASCHHGLINPVGFGLESFDAIGQWRTMDNGKPVDSSGKLAGTAQNASFPGPAEMAKAISEAPEARLCYAKQWWRYSYGRSEGEGDLCALQTLAQGLASDAYTARDLLVDMVRTKAFMYRSAEGQ